tara:strand:- start:382 stop:507 length:126 start_codon:yes stop_codon:yes gene_type:complete
MMLLTLITVIIEEGAKVERFVQSMGDKVEPLVFLLPEVERL